MSDVVRLGPEDLASDPVLAGGIGEEPPASFAELPTPMLECQDLVLSYGRRTAVDGLTLSVAPGEAYGLIGPNGAGKTTVIKLVCGILAPEAGSVRIGGGALDRSGRAAALSQVGYVPQDLALFPNLTLEENVSFWCRIHGLPRRARSPRIAEVLELVGLGDRAKDRLERCSGGMQRRVNLAVALVHEPRLLVLDEPTVGVDAQSRASLLATIGALRDEGVAVLYTSHYFDEVEKLCDRIGIQDGGRLVVEGTATELLSGGATEGLEGLFLRLTGTDLRD